MEIITGPKLSERTTLGFGGEAGVEATVRREDDLDALSDFLVNSLQRPFILGWGSNVLAGEDLLDIALIRVLNSSDIEQTSATDATVTARVPAGHRLPGLLSWARNAGFGGLENLNGIPGTVGGAIAMNAGSYGTEIGELVKQVRIWTPGTGLMTMDGDQFEWGYRHFRPKIGPSHCLVWDVELELTISTTEEVRANMQAIMEKKKATQPIAAKTAGCVFKNPEGHSAGLLLDKAGFKGKRLGNVGFSELHANFLVNHGNGTATEALELMELAREAVKTEFDVTLETEVIIL